jgi:hypothetical protein
MTLATNGYVIEIDDEAAGLLVREGRSYAFHAVGRRYASLEGAIFATPHAAERAARDLSRPRAARLPAAAPVRIQPHDGGWAGSMMSGGRAEPFGLSA